MRRGPLQCALHDEVSSEQAARDGCSDSLRRHRSATFNQMRCEIVATAAYPMPSRCARLGSRFLAGPLPLLGSPIADPPGVNGLPPPIAFAIFHSLRLGGPCLRPARCVGALTRAVSVDRVRSEVDSCDYLSNIPRAYTGGIANILSAVELPASQLCTFMRGVDFDAGRKPPGGHTPTATYCLFPAPASSVPADRLPPESGSQRGNAGTRKKWG